MSSSTILRSKDRSLSTGYRPSFLLLLLTLTVLFDGSLLLYRNIHLTGCWRDVHGLSDLMAGHRGYGFLFLAWNLFLGWIPYAISLLLRQGQTAWLKYTLLLAWLLFFPNAPYIVTDLIHLQERPPVPMWYDLLTIAAFAWTGMVFGYLSLIRVHQVLIGEWGRPIGHSLVGIALVLAGLGVYIGRFLRYNSWDVLTRPWNLLADLGSILIDPALHWPGLGAGILLSVLLTLGYFTLRWIP